MSLYIQIDFYDEETQAQWIICDLNSEIKGCEESKVDHYEENSEVLNEQNFDLDRDSNLSKCRHQIDNFNWIEFNWVLLIFLNS